MISKYSAVTGHRVEGGYRNTIPAPSGMSYTYQLPGPLGYYLPRGGNNILDAWSRMMRTEEVFLTDSFPYSPTVPYDLEGLSVLYCIVQYSGHFRYLPERN